MYLIGHVGTYVLVISPSAIPFQFYSVHTISCDVLPASYSFPGTVKRGCHRSQVYSAKLTTRVGGLALGCLH